MTNENIENWWNFSIEAQVRTDANQREFTGENQINPTIEGDRKTMSYHSFLKLDDLLNAQVPATKIPDERIFLITHQLFELIFKQMGFDLQIILSTFEQLLSETEDKDFLKIVSLKHVAGEDVYWRPAVFAANRIAFTCKEMLPTTMTFLSGSKTTGGELFSSREFQYFRESLVPSSGFQSAQLRLIQRAFGKTNLLDLQNFPAKSFAKHYQGKQDDSLVSSSSKLILQEGASIAFPEEGDLHGGILRLDDVCHKVLARLSSAAGLEPSTANVSMIEDDVIGKVSSTVIKILKSQAPHLGKDKTAAIQGSFEANFAEVIKKENTRREQYPNAPAGAKHMLENIPHSRVKQVLDSLVMADNAMFGRENDSFLKKHYDVAKFHTDALSLKGTGGGGLPYLSLSLNLLLPLFPALVGYQKLD